jgi:hypothetical protein
VTTARPKIVNPVGSRIRVDIGRTVRWDDTTIGQEFSGVFEEDDAVAQQAPSLLRVGGNGVRGVPVDSVGRWALRLVAAHGVPPKIWNIHRGRRCGSTA